MLTSWMSCENGVKKSYTPTAEDLRDLEEAFNPQEASKRNESATQVIARGFLSGMAGQIGYSSARGVYSAIAQSSSSSPAISDRNITLCKSHNKIHERDLRRMSEQIQTTEQHLAQAAQAKNQAIQETQAAYIKLLNHANLPIPNELGTLVFETIPDMVAIKQQELRACTEYNHSLQKYAQEKALYERMIRAYNDQNQGDPGFWISISDGIFRFVVKLFSSDF